MFYQLVGQSKWMLAELTVYVKAVVSQNSSIDKSSVCGGGIKPAYMRSTHAFTCTAASAAPAYPCSVIGSIFTS